MRRRRYRRYKRDDDLERSIAGILTLGLLGLVWYFWTNKEQVLLYGAIVVAILVGGYVIYYLFIKRKKQFDLSFNDDQILFMLKGMSPAQFEQTVAEMFERLGYKAEVIGGANDGGIDVIARKDGKKYFIQCKKFMTREVTPHDVRDFLGAITNINNPADKGYFVTTGIFTLMAEKAAEGNPRIELIDGTKLVEYYKFSYGKSASENLSPPPIQPQG
jgi:HJR/Mrr/RecB family endonuclease